MRPAGPGSGSNIIDLRGISDMRAGANEMRPRELNPDVEDINTRRAAMALLRAGDLRRAGRTKEALAMMALAKKFTAMQEPVAQAGVRRRVPMGPPLVPGVPPANQAPPRNY